MEENSNKKDTLNTTTSTISDIETDNNGPFDTLCISGGSTKGVIFMGALHYIYHKQLHKGIKTFVGTSVGAIISYFLAIGYNPMELLLSIIETDVLANMDNFNILGIANNSGVIPFDIIDKELTRMTLKKIGVFHTLSSLRSETGNTLVCVTYNASLDRTEYLHPDTHPNIPCLTALRMTANMPFIFEQFQYQRQWYFDGGISNNFPLLQSEKYGNSVLGVCLNPDDPDENRIGNECPSGLMLGYKLMWVPINESIKHQLASSKPSTYILKVKSSGQKCYDLKIHAHEALDMFASGAKQVREQVETFIKQELHK